MIKMGLPDYINCNNKGGERMISEVCEYFPCVTAERTGKNCADNKNCQTHKFYRKHGTEYLFKIYKFNQVYKIEPLEIEPLGIGALCNPNLFSELEKMLNKDTNNNIKEVE